MLSFLYLVARDDKVHVLPLYHLQGSDSNGLNKENKCVAETGINETADSSLRHKGASVNTSSPD